MRTGHLTGTALAAVLVLGMTGCVGGDPLPTLPPTPSTTPVFASEEEALAAAEEAYAAYLEMSNLISSEGGAEPERIATVAAGDLLDASFDGFATLRTNGWRTEGLSRLVASELQYADLAAEPEDEAVAAYVCVDVSGVDVLDSSGVSVVDPSRPDLQAFEVFFRLLAEGGLIPVEREAWEATSICGDA